MSSSIKLPKSAHAYINASALFVDLPSRLSFFSSSFDSTTILPFDMVLNITTVNSSINSASSGIEIIFPYRYCASNISRIWNHICDLRLRYTSSNSNAGLLRLSTPITGFPNSSSLLNTPCPTPIISTLVIPGASFTFLTTSPVVLIVLASTQSYTYSTLLSTFFTSTLGSPPAPTSNPYVTILFVFTTSALMADSTHNSGIILCADTSRRLPSIFVCHKSVLDLFHVSAFSLMYSSSTICILSLNSSGHSCPLKGFP